jgi:acyl-CoA oxidase
MLYLPLPNNLLEYKSYGPHLFIVPVRSLETHELLPGIIAGDIGPKAYGGFGMLDNGYIHFSDVRIPLENMLMKHAKVTPMGEYIPAKHDKLSYGSMVALRAAIPASIGLSLAKAVTIAIRYCIHRRQFSDVKGGPERQVITYASVKHRLFPLLASSYAYIIAGRELWSLYQKMLEDIVQRGNVESLAEMHCLSTAVKVKSSMDCTKGIEEARKAMGGHGYSHMSGIGHLFANSTPAQTYEGDNYVIAQQTARSLLKHVAKLRSQGGNSYTLPASSSYLQTTLIAPSKFSAQRSAVRNTADWFNHAHQIAALEHRAAYLVSELGMDVSSGGKEWAAYSWVCFRVATAHADVFCASAFHHAISSAHTSLSEDARQALELLCTIHTLHTLVDALPELFECGYINATQSRLLRKALDEAVCMRMTVEAAVKLIDAFAFTDYEMGGSALGREDGKVYEEMWRIVRERAGEEEKFRDGCLEIIRHYVGGNGKPKL